LALHPSGRSSVRPVCVQHAENHQGIADISEGRQLLVSAKSASQAGSQDDQADGDPAATMRHSQTITLPVGNAMQLNWVDWGIIGGFIFVSLAIGILVSRRAGGNSESFFLSCPTGYWAW
jgi:hypothetical protein